MSDIDLRFYLSVMLRRLPYFLMVALPLAAVALVVALILPPTFRSSAKILVEAAQISTDLAPSTVQTSAVEQFEIIQQQIMTRENLLALAEKFHLYDTAAPLPSPSDMVADMQDTIGFEQIRPAWSQGQGATVFRITFDARDPRKAAGVVNDLVTFILAKNEQWRTGRAEETARFFQQEVGMLGDRLGAIEADILKFKNGHKDALPEDLEFHRTQQASYQERLFSLSREEGELRTRRTSLVQEGELEVMGAGPSGLTNDEQMLQDMQRVLSNQLTVFSETSPNITALKVRIASLQRRIQESAPIDKDTQQPKRHSPARDLQLSDMDQRLQSIGRERAAVRGDLERLTGAIAATPGNETTLNAMTRNRDNVQRQYTLATARLAEAATGERVEMRSKGARFSLVEPAVPPVDPIGPKRRKIVLAGGGAAVALGAGLVLLLELINKTIRRPRDLGDRLGVNPLVTIPYIRTPREKLALNLMWATAVFGCAAAVSAIAVALYLQYAPLDAMVRGLLAGRDGGGVIEGQARAM